MRSAPTAVKDLLVSSNVCWRADLYTITLASGTVYRWTSADVALVVGGNTYASGPVMSRRLRQARFPEVDELTLEMQGAYPFGAQTLSQAAILGAFDGARLQLDHVVGAYPGDLSKGVCSAWFSGRVAGVEPTPTSLRMSVKSDVEELTTIQIPRFVFSPQCGHIVYDANCGVSKAAFTASASVVASPTPTALTFSGSAGIAGTLQDHYYMLGVVAFTGNVTPALAGVRRAVREYVGSGSRAFTLARALPVAPAAGDTFTVYPGCTRTQTTCQAVFANIANFRGTPHIPPPQGEQ